METGPALPGPGRTGQSDGTEDGVHGSQDPPSGQRLNPARNVPVVVDEPVGFRGFASNAGYGAGIAARRSTSLRT